MHTSASMGGGVCGGASACATCGSRVSTSGSRSPVPILRRHLDTIPPPLGPGAACCRSAAGPSGVAPCSAGSCCCAGSTSASSWMRVVRSLAADRPAELVCDGGRGRPASGDACLTAALGGGGSRPSMRLTGSLDLHSPCSKPHCWHLQHKHNNHLPQPPATTARVHWAGCTSRLKLRAAPRCSSPEPATACTGLPGCLPGGAPLRMSWAESSMDAWWDVPPSSRDTSATSASSGSAENTEFCPWQHLGVHEAVWMLWHADQSTQAGLSHIAEVQSGCTPARRPGQLCCRLVLCAATAAICQLHSCWDRHVAAKRPMSGSAGGHCCSQAGMCRSAGPRLMQDSPAKRPHLPRSSLSVSSPSSRSDPIAEAAAELKPCKEQLSHQNA